MNERTRLDDRILQQERRVRTPALDQVTIDLIDAVQAGKLEAVIGRHQEIEYLIQILARHKKNNPLLIGEPGVGKTTIVEGLAQRLATNEVPEGLLGKRLLAFDVGTLLTGTKYYGEFEERLKRVLEEIQRSRECIIFIDDIHTLVGAGAAEGTTDATTLLEEALSHGEIQCIGATTFDEYRQSIECDIAFQRHFQQMIVKEASIEETLEILKRIRERYEQHQRVTITDEALKAATVMASRYLTNRFMPDKAIDLIDEAASRARMQNSLAPLNLKEAMKALESVLREKEQAIQQQDYELTAELRVREVELRVRITQLESGWHRERGSEKLAVGEEHIAQTVSMWTGIPVILTTQEESQHLHHMEEALRRRVIGQNEAIETISQAMRRARAGLKDPKRPSGSFLFLGPSGVGKSELAKALAEFLFGSEDALIRFDMSQLAESSEAVCMVGTSPENVDDEASSQLIEAVLRRSHMVILLDNFEKVHLDAFPPLLQILADGKLIDAKGRTVDFRHTIVIMTSNAGASLLNTKALTDFKQPQEKVKANQAENHSKGQILSELRSVLPPEFLNSIDEIIVFHSLCTEEMDIIIESLIQRINTQLAEKQLELVIPHMAKDFLIEKSCYAQYGAALLRRTIQRLIEEPFAEGLLSGVFKRGDLVEALIIDHELHLKVCNRIELLPPG